MDSVGNDVLNSCKRSVNSADMIFDSGREDIDVGDGTFSAIWPRLVYDALSGRSFTFNVVVLGLRAN